MRSSMPAHPQTVKGGSQRRQIFGKGDRTTLGRLRGPRTARIALPIHDCEMSEEIRAADLFRLWILWTYPKG
jgi:hypothetical protein